MICFLYAACIFVLRSPTKDLISRSDEEEKPAALKTTICDRQIGQELFLLLEFELMKQILLLSLFLQSITGFADALFEVPETLHDNVAFWKKIYTSYDSHQVVFFDQEDLTVIYAVLDLPKVPGEISSPKYKPKVKARFLEIEKHLKELSEGIKPVQESEDYKTIKALLAERNLLGTPDLDKRLRHQSGLKSQFALGLKLSGRYVEDVQAILKSQSLPPELVALPFVESLWFSSALSHKGAKGPWGIMPETGRALKLQINDFVDERVDWQKSTVAAARFLKTAYDDLGEWGAAITAYNYGLNGMRRAKATIGSANIADILKLHDSPIFGFASRNYAAEAAAAQHVFENQNLYFPDVVKDKPQPYELVQIEKAVLASDLYHVKALTRDELSSLNPSLTKKTLDGHEVIPALYSLRVPQGKAKLFSERIKKLDPKKHHAAQMKVCRKYPANGRETIAKIASKNGVSAEYLAEKLQKPTSYKPKGTVLIRSHAHLFSQLKDIAKLIAQGKKPTEIAVSEAAPKN